MNDHTPGPWGLTTDTREEHLFWWVNAESTLGLCVIQGPIGNPQEAGANARLIAKAPDNALVLAALCQGKAQWEKYGRNELCIGGLCYTLEMDEFGCPILTDVARNVLKAELKNKDGKGMD